MDRCIEAINYCAKVYLKTRDPKAKEAFLFWAQRLNTLKSNIHGN